MIHEWSWGQGDGRGGGRGEAGGGWRAEQELSEGLLHLKSG